jgi:hypothetical protein
MAAGKKGLKSFIDVEIPDRRYCFNMHKII